MSALVLVLALALVLTLALMPALALIRALLWLGLVWSRPAKNPANPPAPSQQASGALWESPRNCRNLAAKPAMGRETSYRNISPNLPKKLPRTPPAPSVIPTFPLSQHNGNSCRLISRASPALLAACPGKFLFRTHTQQASLSGPLVSRRNSHAAPRKLPPPNHAPAPDPRASPS